MAKKPKIVTKTVFLHQGVKSLIKTKVKRNKSKSEVSTPNSSKEIIKEEKTNKTYRKLKTFNLYHLDDILRGINRSEWSETVLIDENIQGLILVVKGSNANLKNTRSGITNMGYGLQVFAQKNETCLPLYSVKGRVYMKATPLPYFGAKDKSEQTAEIHAIGMGIWTVVNPPTEYTEIVKDLYEYKDCRNLTIIVESKAVIGLLNIKEFDKFNKTREKITKTINDHINNHC